MWLKLGQCKSKVSCWKMDPCKDAWWRWFRRIRHHKVRRKTGNKPLSWFLSCLVPIRTEAIITNLVSESLQEMHRLETTDTDAMEMDDLLSWIDIREVKHTNCYYLFSSNQTLLYQKLKEIWSQTHYLQVPAEDIMWQGGEKAKFDAPNQSTAWWALFYESFANTQDILSKTLLVW